ncbi:EamA domain-containing membrane protein RarD [Methylophilus rhizosphaerae]|uniref:EamA domain-containing membrane protein RarD n=1 Tax=Methylophilus rhizosphaerae TaxID=492660 RepID=A0A1G9CI52_9PROT|nr:DMT family transporter [Methylophilus rhizosphaerae]SDK51319.1 EamA domain-containing membrane protein RarD [Methylophilus rhizosphaerae]
MKQSPHPYYGAILVLLSSIVFSSKAIMVKLAYVYHVDAASLITLRMAFALPFFAMLGWWATRQGSPATLTAKDWGWLVILAVVGGYGSMWLNFEGLRFVSAGLERVILFLYPTLVVVMSAVFLKHHITRREWFAMVISYAGVVLVVWHDIELSGLNSADTMYGAWLVLLSAVVYAGYLLGCGQLIPKLGATRFTAFTMSLAAFASACQFGVSGSFAGITALPSQVYALALLMAIVATVLPAILMNLGIHQLGSRKASLISAIGPVSTIILAYVFLGEQLSWIQGAGTALVVAGVIAVSLDRTPQVRATDADV